MNDWTFSGELASTNAGPSDATFGTVGLEYGFANGISLGLDHAAFDLFGRDIDLTSIYGTYQIGEYVIGVSFGDTSDLNDPVYSIYGAWDVAPGATVGMDVVRSSPFTLISGYADYDVGNYTFRADLITIDDGFVDQVSFAGGYRFGNGFSVIGSLSAFDFGRLNYDGASVTIGGQYEFAKGANIELAVGRIWIGNLPNVDQVSFGLNYETGRKTSRRRSLGNILTINSIGSPFAGLIRF